MKLEVDPDILAVAEFMQQNIPAARLLGVAAGINGIAPLLWSRYESGQQIFPLSLLAYDPEIRPDANELRPVPQYVDGDFAVAVDVAQ